MFYWPFLKISEDQKMVTSKKNNYPWNIWEKNSEKNIEHKLSSRSKETKSTDSKYSEGFKCPKFLFNVNSGGNGGGKEQTKIVPPVLHRHPTLLLNLRFAGIFRFYIYILHLEIKFQSIYIKNRNMVIFNTFKSTKNWKGDNL